MSKKESRIKRANRVRLKLKKSSNLRLSPLGLPNIFMFNW